MTQELNDRTIAFLLNDKLDFSMYDLCRYIEEEYKTVDIYNIKKKYIQISDDHSNVLNDMLSNFILNKLNEVNEDLPNINENIDVFFDVIIDSSEGSITIERSSYN